MVFASIVLPPIVAEPAADAVFTKDGGCACLVGTVDVVEVVLVVVLTLGTTTSVDWAPTIVVDVVDEVDDVEATLLSTNVNSEVVT